MGEVYLAFDTRLSRNVAIKLLPIEFTADAGRVRRFEQEARATSALNHPNIITIHEIGETPKEGGGRRYIVTEYIEGETLRHRIRNLPQGRMALSEAIHVALQIAAALSAAHSAGIAHRDIKPENVMVRRDQLVKVLDFGLAKLTELPAPEADSQDSTLIKDGTASGIVIGTPRYMSPEQARGEKVDARTDIFSLGVMLYEMIAGSPPFAGETAGEIIASILRDEPAQLSHYASETPLELERIVAKALSKSREERYQNVNDLIEDVKKLERDLLFASAARETSVSPAPLSVAPARGIPNKRRIVSIVALAGLVIAAIVAAVMWTSSNPSPVLTNKDTILLADFESNTGDQVFDVVLKQGLAIQLQQSPFLNLYPDAQVRHELKLMRRQPEERVTAEIAREICKRQNLKAWIAGSMAPLGSHYVITLEALNGQTDETLAREQVEAENKEQVLRALSQAATRLRGRLGESLSSIQLYDRPLEDATTAQPEAFKAYSQALELAVSGKLRDAIPFYQHAIKIDPDFAMANNGLAIMYWVTGRPGQAAEYSKKAYGLKDHVGELEKFRIIIWYHQVVTGDLNKRIEALMLEKRTYPREYTGPGDLAVTYNVIGRPDEAILEARESIRLNANYASAQRSLAWALLRLNRFSEARDVLTQVGQQGREHPDFHFLLYQLAFISNDTTEMQRQIDSVRGKPDEYAAFDWQTGAAAFAGQWRKAQELSRRAIDLAAHGDAQEIAARYATEQATRGAVIGDCRHAIADAAQGLKLARSRAVLARDALALVLCGESNQAKPLNDELIKLYPEDTIINSIWAPAISAAMNLGPGASGNGAAQAVVELQITSRYEAAAEFWPQYLRGTAYLKLQRGAEAAAEFQKILDHRGYVPLSPLYPLGYLGLARAATLTGETAKSRKAYEDFFAVWKEADSDLPILIDAKKEYERLK